MGQGASVGGSAVILVTLQDSDAKPAPIDTVTLDLPFIVEVHHLDEVHLLALPRVARIFPDQALPIGKVTRAVIQPNRWLALGKLREQRAQLVATTQRTRFRAEQMRHQRALEMGIGYIESAKCVGVIA